MRKRDVPSPRVARVGQAVWLADDAQEALRSWLLAVRPAADLVSLIEPETRRPAVSFQRQRSTWRPVALPPVAIQDLPTDPERRDLARGAHEAVDDLLLSLGMTHSVIVPLEPVAAGALLVGRSDAAYSDREMTRLVDRSRWIGPVLSGLARRKRQVGESLRASREVAGLLELTRGLASAVDVDQVGRVATRALQKILRPDAGALRLRLEPRSPGSVSVWPADASGRRAADALAAGSEPTAGAGRGLCWLRPESPPAREPGTDVDLLLGWRRSVPEAAERVIAAVQSTVYLALARLRAQLRLEEGRLQATVEGLPLGVALVGADDRPRLINEVGRGLLAELGSWSDARVPLATLGSLDLEPLFARARAGQSSSAEVFFPLGGRTLELRVVPAGPHANGDSRDVLAIFEDVTEARRRTRQLAQAEKLTALGTLISGIVHEINNPLSTVLGYAQMLSQDPDSSSRERWIELLDSEAQRCQRIVGNMLALARSSDTRREQLSLGALAERALELLRYPFRVAGIDASLQASPDTPAIEGDADGLLQALINLLTNALHALQGAECQGGPRQVRVEIVPDGRDQVCLSVSDNGPGISPENIGRIFDPFFTSKPEGQGTGLGLSLVEATVRDHGGQIDVDSVPGEGARFSITLPLGGRPSELCSESHDEASLDVLGGLANRRIAVVDDEPAVAELLRVMLERAGAEVQSFVDATEALSVILEQRPDAVIADLRMPAVSGEELYGQLRQIAPELAERFMFTTGDLISANGRPGAEYSGRPCLIKPFKIRTVVELVREVIEAAERAADA
ncbi:MAG: response regulator [Acidobacteriota bacterium]|nr:MAG: response regulator [Acidobacteriota bacterium]